MIGQGRKSVAWVNPQGYVYINGTANINGSRRFSIDEDTGNSVIEKLIDDLWQPASFETGPNSLWVGRNVGIAGVGHHLVTESADGHLHFHAHSEYDEETCITDAQIVNVYQFTERLVYQPDESGSWTGTNYEFISPAPEHTIVSKGYLKTDTTAATKPVRIQTWTGTDDTGDLIFNQWYPASNFPASSEIDIEYAGALEFVTGNNYFTRYSSEADFSMKMNAAGTFPWVAADLGMVREENLLQTKGWVSEDTWTEKDYFIDGRKIYVCNVTGVQTGTWEDNSDKWDILSDKGYVDSFDNKALKTGIISGGALSIASSTTISIAPGTGIILDSTDASNIIRTDVSWDEVLGYSPNLSLDGSNIILVDSSGTISDIRNVDKTDETYRDYIILGTISIFMGGIIMADSRPYNLGYVSQSFEDFHRDVIGPATISGLIYSSNTTDLALKYSSGRIYDIGCGFALGEQNTPNEKDISGATTPVLFMTYHDGPTLLPDGSPTIYVNPDKIDNGDGTTSPVGNNNWTIQRIFYSPTATLVSYGQEEYNTFDLALDAMYSQEFFEAGALPASWFRAYLIIKEGAIDLSDTTQAVFFEAPKFRLSGAGGGASVGVSAHSSLLRLEWNVAGHLFENGGTLDIGGYGFITTNYIAGESLIVAGAGTDGSTLLNFNMIRRWAFQQEGSGTACALRLRNTLGQNKNFFIDTNGNTSWRNYDGSGLHTTINSNGFWGKLGSTVVATTQPQLDNSTRVATTAYADTASGSNLWTKISTTLKNNSGVDTFEFDDGVRVRLAVTPSAAHMRSPNSENIVWVDNTGTAIVGKLTVNLDLIAQSDFYLGDPDTDGTGLIKMEGNEIEFWTRVGGVYNKVGGFS